MSVLRRCSQEAELRARPDIVVCTPGRMVDHITNSASVHMEDVEILVLDEVLMGVVVVLSRRGKQTKKFGWSFNLRLRACCFIFLKKV